MMIEDTPLNTPVLFLVFNRPETTTRVFEAIRKARPVRLYVVADGAREGRGVEEIKRCEEVRKIATAVDWECQVHTLFRTENLGCGRGLSGAITWFFEQETEGIILEDDCLPSPAFFRFTSELLERYRDDTRVMEIGGNNFEEVGDSDTDYSYRFSKLTYIWGWATWRRAWKLNDFHMKHYNEVNEKQFLEASYPGLYERDFFQYVFRKMHAGDDKISSRTIWSYQWQFACMIHSGLIVVPSSNLVINLGFGSEATNTHSTTAAGHDLILEAIDFPLRHPPFMMVDPVKERKVFKMIATSSSSRIRSQIKNLLPHYLVEKVVRPIVQSFTSKTKAQVQQLETR